MHSLATGVHILVVLVRSTSGPLALSCGIDLLELVVFRHRVWRRDILRRTGRENGFEGLDLLLGHAPRVAVGVRRSMDTLGELDVELNVQIAEVVVSV